VRPLVLVLAALASVGCSIPASAPTPEVPAVLLGSPAPPFSVSTLRPPFETVRLSSLRGKVVVVDFFDSRCEPCKVELPQLEALYDRYRSRGLEIMAVSEDEPEDKDGVPAFAASAGASFPVGWDDEHFIRDGYGPGDLPTSYVIDRRGLVRFQHIGYREGQEMTLEREIVKLLGEGT
jgi:cytochrome c biogenesis protein CcmG, thiol:disulfide interchange protein DsbE